MATPADEPDYEYIAYIDEAGDPGIERVRPIDPVGSTEWFVMGATVIRKARESEVIATIRKLVAELRIPNANALHFRQLAPHRKMLVCTELAKFPARHFAVASNKKNMRGHRNAKAAQVSANIGSGQIMYNYCSRILLERVTAFVEEHSIAEFGSPRRVKCIFSTRGGHNYGQLFAYLEMLKNQARAGTTFLKKREIKWTAIDHRLLDRKPHWFSAGLQMSDAIASAFYQAVDVLDVTDHNCSFAEALRPTIATEGGTIADFGVTLLPHQSIARLLPEQRSIFRFYGYQI